MGSTMITIRVPKFQMDKFPTRCESSLCAIGLSKTELNNMIYMFLRYGYRFNSEWHAEPVNAHIAKIMESIGESEVSKDRIISETVKFVKKQYDLSHLSHYDLTPDDVEKQLDKLYNQFFMLPDSLRSNLGDDAESNEFLDKN